VNWAFNFVRMKDAMLRLLLLLGLLLGLTSPYAAQDAASVLLPRINNLRAAKGLPAYAPHASLTAAANEHARWMAVTGEIAHYQQDGSGPRARAVRAGFPSSWISENIYRGANALSAWQWWLNSPIHYAGLVSPHYDKIGIGSASGAQGNTYVLVFGNSTGRLLEASARAADGGGSVAGVGPPSYVLGLDEVGNIQHQIQPGQDLGTIALIYGYTWDDIPYMLEINGMSWDDIRLLQPGEVFLVPPKAGTYTPAPANPADAARPTFTATAASKSTARPSQTPVPPPPTEPATAAIRIRALPGASVDRVSSSARSVDENLPQLAILGIAILIQLGMLGGAMALLIYRR